MSSLRDLFRRVSFKPWPTPYPLWNTVVWQIVGTAICVVFIPNEPLLIALRIAMVSVWSAVFIIFLPDAWRSMFARSPTSGQRLCLAVGVSAISIVGLSNLSVLWRLSPQRWITDSDFSVIFCIAGVVAGFQHCRAPESIDKQMPPRDRLTLGVALGVAVAATTTILVMQPHVQLLIDGLQPYFPNVALWTMPWGGH